MVFEPSSPPIKNMEGEGWMVGMLRFVQYPTQTILFWMSLIAIYLLAAGIQSVLLLNWDVSWLMLVSRRLLAGGVYGKDFFEFNPPMILYLYIPPVLLTKIFSISIISALRSYVFCLATLSLFVCYRLGQKIFSANANGFLTIIIAIIFLVLPTFELGQREHLLIILAMPYLLLVGLRLGHQSISNYFALWIGVMAGLGFAIKPFFLMTFILVELYKIIVQRNVKAWLSIETLTIIFILIIYALTSFVFYPEYFNIVLPVTMKNYYQGFSYPFNMLIFRPIFFFCCIAGVFGWVFPDKKQLTPVLVIALIGFLFSYLCQRTIWNYHLLPAFSVAFLIVSLQFWQLAQETLQGRKPRLKEKIFVAFLGVIVFISPIYIVGFNTLYVKAHYKEKISFLINFLLDHAKNQPVYFFTATTVYAFPAIDYSQSIHASRFAFLGWIPGALKKNNLPMKNYYLDLMTKDLEINKPIYIFVDIQKSKSNLEEEAQFDFISYFSTDKNFQKIWKNYRYFTTLDQSPAYKFAVYKLI